MVRINTDTTKAMRRRAAVTLRERLETAQRIRAACWRNLVYHRRKAAYWYNQRHIVTGSFYRVYTEEWEQKYREACREVWDARREFLAADQPRWLALVWTGSDWDNPEPMPTDYFGALVIASDLEARGRTVCISMGDWRRGPRTVTRLPWAYDAVDEPDAEERARQAGYGITEYGER